MRLTIIIYTFYILMKYLNLINIWNIIFSFLKIIKKFRWIHVLKRLNNYFNVSILSIELLFLLLWIIIDW